MARDVEIPGSASDGGQQDDGWSADGSLPKDLQIETPADSAAAAPVPIKGKQKAEPEKPEEGQEPEPEKEAKAEGEEEEEAEVEPEAEEEEPEADVSKLQSSLTETQGKLTQMEKMLQFYQTSYNELLTQAKGAGIQPPPGEQAAKGKPTQQDQALTDAELQAPPPEWKTSEEVVQYFDKRNQSLIKREIGRAVQQYVGEIDKSFTRVNQAIHSFIDRSVKPNHKDFDDVIKEVNNELFILDPTGQNIVGYRNQALLQYFQTQPIPILAMYDYGVSKRAPQKTKQAAKDAAAKATKTTIQKIANRPKAPTKIKGGASSEEVEEIGWNDRGQKVEQYLSKKRLI